ncbi:hypothetical protein HPHPP41_0118 [Helicobacter pylori Hp P-41]|nr:hypothetical protein HPHPP41_0118 [Helicobacter pylori Hp P-41]
MTTKPNNQTPFFIATSIQTTSFLLKPLYWFNICLETPQKPFFFF